MVKEHEKREIRKRMKEINEARKAGRNEKAKRKAKELVQYLEERGLHNPYDE